MGNASVSGKQGGNIELKNEGADAWTAGIIFRPRWVDGLMLSVDYVDIDIEDAIEAFSLTQIMRGCYDAADFPNELCNSFRREANGQLPASDAFQVGFVNAGQRTFKAYTIEGIYSMDLWNGQLDLGVSAINITESKTVVLGSPDEDAGEIGSPDWQANFTFRYSRDKWSALLQPRMIGDGVRNLDDEADRWSVPKEDTVWIVNGAFNYAITDSFDVQFNINNMFDELPSAHVIAWGRDQVYDNFGRFYRFGLVLRL